MSCYARGVEQLVGLAVIALVVVAILWTMRANDARAPAAPSRPYRHTTPLGAAIAEGRIEDVRSLLASGCDPNEAAEGDLPALHWAAHHGRTEAIAPLVAAGAVLDYADPAVGGALALALASAHEETAIALLDANVSLDVVNDGGATALHIAAMVGTEETVSAILDRGAAIDAFNFQGGTPLRSAAAQGRRENVALLIARGAHRATRDAFGKLPIDYAREAHFDEIARLLEGASPIDAPPQGRPALARLLPPRGDATLNVVASTLEQGHRLARVGASSVEAPTLIHAIRRVGGLEDFDVEVSRIDDPDPRSPVRPVTTLLWRYDGTGPKPVPRPAHDATAASAAALAQTPYALELWSARAAKDANQLSPASLVAVMAIPPPGPRHLPPWHWAFRCQVAAALMLAHRASEGRLILLDVLDGPADWSNTAAVVALYDLARRDPSARPDVERALWATVRRRPTAPSFQHAIEPAAQALRELGVHDPAGELAQVLDRPIA